jgi:type I restriction enzyme S subunit
MSKKKQKSIEELLEEALVPEEEQPYPVPENWVWTRLGNLIELVYGKSLPDKKRSGNGFPVYGSNGVVGYHSEFLIEGPVIIVGRKGSYGEVNWYNESGWAIDTTYYVLAKQKINYKYVYYLLKTLNLKKLNRSTAIPGLNREDAYTQKVVLPPFKEQKRIVERIDRLFAKIDEAKQLIEEVKGSFELRRAAILDKAFKGQLGTNDPNEKSLLETCNDLKEKDLIPKEEQPYEVPGNWVWVKLKSCLKRLQYGYTASSSTLEEGPKYLRITDIQNDSVDWKTVPHCKINADLLEKYKLNKGDIVIARTGATTGKSFLIDDVPYCSVFASYLIRLTTNEDLNPRYLWNYLKSSVYWKQITVVKRGIAQPGANAQIIGGLSVPLPPVHEQKRIADKVDILLSKLETEKEMVLEVEQKLDLLKQTILTKAYLGELGTNDPTEEIAIELLKEVLKSR